MIYNKKLVPTPPKTSGELVTLGQEAHRRRQPGRFGLAYWYSDFYYHAALMNAFGGARLRPGREAGPQRAGEREVARAPDEVVRARTRSCPPSPPRRSITSLFNEGKAAIVFSGPWFLGEIAKGIDYGLAPLPDDRRGRRQADAPVDDRRGRLHRRAVEEQGGRLRLREVRHRHCRRRRSSPSKGARRRPTRRSTTTRRWRPTPILKAFRKQVEVAIPMPNLPEMTMVWSPATTAMNTIVQKSATPKAAMDVAQKEVERDVARLRKK